MSENYTEIKRILSNVRYINAFVRETDYVFLCEAHEKLGAALANRKLDFEREQEESKKKEEKKKELLALIASEGFTLSELQGSSVKIAHRQAKYTFEDNGKMKTWSGVGKKPKPIAAALADGKSLEDFLIK